MAGPPEHHVSEGAMRFRDRVRSPGDLQRLSDFDQRIYLPLVLSAILPIVTAASNASTDSWVSIIVNVAAWIVFVIDLTVHVRLVRGYLRSAVGVFDLVVVMLGDHQPATIVSGDDAGHDVPVSVIARDPAVLARIDGWGWDHGLHPSPEAPVWRMDLFRDRFLTAYSAGD